MSVHTISNRARRALEVTDEMPPGLRQCVHEFGYAIVNACLTMGVKEPRHIRALVREIWDGARQPAQRQRGIGDANTHQCAMLAKLDWLLLQSGSAISAATLIRVLWNSGYVVIPNDPSDLMAEASMAEVTGHTEVMTKRQKHKRRLKAAIHTQAKRLWPHLFEKDAAA